MRIRHRIGRFPGDDSASAYDDLAKQRKAVRRRIAGCATARTRIAYQQAARLQQGEHGADFAVRTRAFTTQLALLDQMEGVLREREARLTLRIGACEP